MIRLCMRRPRLTTTTALATVAAVMALAGPSVAATNTIRIDLSGTGRAPSLTINQDAANGGENVISANGAAGGGSLLVRGQWGAINIVQRGGDNTLGGAITGGGTSGSLSLSYGSNDVGGGGNNIHMLTIGATTAPTNPTVAIDVNNTDPAVTDNTITDVLDGTGLTYSLTIDGTDNVIGNTVASTAGALTIAEIFTGDSNIVANSIAASGAIGLNETVTGDTNSITHTITGATTVTSTVTLASNGNTVTNLSNGAGAKTFSVVLNGVEGNTVVNDFTGGSGTQTSNLTSTGVSRLDFELTAGGAGSASSVNAINVVGAGGAAALVRIDQAAGASLILTTTGTGFTAGTGATGGNAVTVNQSAGATANVIYTAAANGYFVDIIQ